ncbi:MAG: metal ABC transporter permease, partial [Fibrobacteraceae bacterium]
MWQYDFMKLAFFAILIVSPLFAMLGSMVVQNKMSFFSDAMGHSALTGIALGACFGLQDPLFAMILFALFLAGVIAYLQKKGTASPDTIISIVMSSAVSLGIVMLSRGGGFAKYSTYLIGDLLSVTTRDIYRMLIVSAVFYVIWAIFFNRLSLFSTNKSLARSRKIPIFFTQVLFSAIVAVIVTLCIQWIGILVINSLLILPAATARNLSKNLFGYSWIAVVISLISGIIGLFISFKASTATGATIVLVLSAFYIASFAIRRLFYK